MEGGKERQYRKRKGRGSVMGRKGKFRRRDLEKEEGVKRG